MVMRQKTKLQAPVLGEQMTRYGLTIGILASLSACGGGATDPTAMLTFAERVDVFDNSFAATRSQPFSNATSVGQASGTYTGTAQVRIVDGSVQQSFLGKSDLTVDVSAGRVSGSLTEFSGGLLSATEEDFTGSVTVTGQSMGLSQDSEFISTVSGTLTGPVNTLALGSGTVLGDLHNNPTTALVASGILPDATLNGVPPSSATISIQAIKD